MLNTSTILDDAIIEHLQKSTPEHIAIEMTHSVLAGNRIIWYGNGGSPEEAQHLAAQSVGRFRSGLPSIALTADSPISTAVGNDCGFDQIFSRPVEDLCDQEDLLLGQTTSGHSKNVCAALRIARDIGAFTVAFTGEGGGLAAEISDLALLAPFKDTAHIQEAHILCGRILCGWIEEYFGQNHAAAEGLSRA